MRVVMFYHSLVSDWNHGNAHFLRGLVGELRGRGHEVTVYEPEGGWSLENLLREAGEGALAAFRAAYPGLDSERYDPRRLDLDQALDRADLVIVHEWSDHELVRRVGDYRRRTPGMRLLFHDTHHRSVTDPESMGAYELAEYDAVLAFGEVIREIYLRRGWGRRAYTLHEAADTRVFFPRERRARAGDLVWIGNWGDDERTAELNEFLFGPARALGLSGRVHGVRYPEAAIERLQAAGLSYGGWLPNHAAPRTFAGFDVTVHVPRRPYVQALPGIPTIRVFEALACGIPLVCAPWDDAEGLFRPGRDYLVARDGEEMTRALRTLLADRDLAREMAAQGLETIRARHTCAHRTDELLRICAELGVRGTPEAPRAPQGA